MKFWSSIFIVICTLWQTAPACGRVLTLRSSQVESQKNAKSRPAPADEELKKRIREQQVTRILAVLSGVANDARNWTDAAAASKVQAQIADVIWDADSDMPAAISFERGRQQARLNYPNRNDRLSETNPPEQRRDAR